MRFLGPVFRHDLVRLARRQPLALWRAAYGLALLAVLFVLYATALPHAWLGGDITPDDASNFAAAAFRTFIAVQFAAVVLVTPALAAGAVAEERANNTLVFLFTTHLTNREIVLGKLFTRLLQVGLLVLTGLPVLALVQLMGGVEPNMVLAAFATLAVTAVSLGGLGLACGVFARKPQTAAWRAYQVVIAYLALSFLSIWYWELPAGPRIAARTAAQQQAMAFFRYGGPNPYGGPSFSWLTGAGPEPEMTLFEQSLEWFNDLNPHFAYLRLSDLQTTGSTLNQALVIVSRDYFIAHGSLALLLCGAAVVRLRSSMFRQSAALTHKKAAILRAAAHPPVGDRPVLWKELYCEAKPRQRWLAVFFSRWFFWASFLPSWFFVVLSIDAGFGQLVGRVSFLLRYVGTFVVGLLCLRVALHAARSIGSERDRETLDSLLTTDLSSDEIVFDKWRGSLLAGRWVLGWLAFHWCLGVMAFALHPLAVPALLIETLTYAAFAASLGMYCAARCATTRQAVAAALVVGLLGTTLLPWTAGKLATAVLPEAWVPRPPKRALQTYPPRPDPEPWPDLLGQGLTPPRVLAATAVPWYEYADGSWFWAREYGDTGEVVLPALIGLGVYGLAAVALRAWAAGRFRRSLPGHPDVSRRFAEA